MAKFEVTLTIEGPGANSVLSDVYKALFVADLDAESVRIKPVKKRGQVVPEVNPRVAKRLLGDDRPNRPEVSQVFPRLRGENSKPFNQG